MIQFNQLRLSGFKSFVDKTELDIGPGLNGIVGPNGCGKSNLVEALRWVMGESSAKRMRGDDMDDVIFAGTDKRSARNFAEVSIVLDNSSRQAPAAYNNHDEIEIVRRIERDSGSNYKINGRNVRARDVQMLFADTITGANSPSLVSQGHVTRLINAKPHDRRLILEESAGISGLYARRHEAELRLKAADTNLTRVQDILGSMENRLNSLKRQAKQASRYKNLSAQIRQMEMMVSYLEWIALQERIKLTEGKFAVAESLVAERLITVTQLTKTQSTQFEELPPLRRKEADLSAALQVQKINFQKLEEECRRYEEDIKNVKDQIAQLEQDKKYETQSLTESTALLERIQEEFATLKAAEDNEDHTVREKQATKEVEESELMALEERYSSLKESAAETRARQNVLEQQITSNKKRIDTLKSRIDAALREKESLVITEESKKQIVALEESIAASEAQLQTANSASELLRAEIKSSGEITENARRALNEAQREHATFSGELSSLERFFKAQDGNDFAPVLDSITTKKGFEKALSRALGDSLLAATSPDAAAYWKDASARISVLPMPAGAEIILPHIDAPKELHAALSLIGYVEDETLGEELCVLLKPGQSLVSAEGTYWRWDGYTVKKSAIDRHAIHLEQKNKLAALQGVKDEIESKLKARQSDLSDAQKQENEKKSAYDSSLQNARALERKLSELRPALMKIKEKSARAQSESEHIEETISIANQDIQSLSDSIASEEKMLMALLENQGESADTDIEKIRQQVTDKRQAYHDAVRAYDMLAQQQSTRRARQQAIADERVSLQNRSIRAREHLKTLATREDSLKQKLGELKKDPKNFEKERENLLSGIAEAESARQIANDRLIACEEELSVTGKALKEAEKTLGDAREERAHAQATLSAITENLREMERAIEETLQVKPKDLIDHAAVDLVKYKVEDLDNLKQEKDKLNKERDGIGPVNLRADDESTELERELTKLLHERNDLMQAIDELRGGIATINKEARERLLIAFERVNAHFQRLFVQLFGGGKAQLELIDSDDPLGAGLEIMAQPPGKTLQSLSLLSGGEQTLTSIALIFAMFLTNPSPICVLDEIDAPLDDSNVDRVCNLLDEIAARGQTRFLIITHHRLSMARMHRLYGVTMAEKGVSQLVSVDLQRSFEFLDKAA